MDLTEQLLLLIAGGALTIVGSGVNSALTARQQSRQRDEVHIADLRNAASTALAMARAVLVDAHPDRVAFNATPAISPMQLDQLRDRWHPARLELFKTADSHPNDTVRAVAQRLEVCVTNLLIADGWLLRDVLEDKDFTEQLKRAKDDYAEADAMADQLGTRLRLGLR